jgi:hypothetical protein
MFLKKIFKIKIPLWLLLAVALVMLVFWVMGIFVGRTPFLSTVITNSKEIQVVKAMKKQKQVSILVLSVTDIYTQSQVSKVAGIQIPLSQKTSYIQGTFDAKLGFDGEDVKIKKLKQKQQNFQITIPKFIVIGVNNPKFKEITNTGQLLSFPTEEIDKLKLQDKALSDKSIQKYIDPNKEWLEEQAKEYYTSLLEGINPDISLSFKFE